MSTKYVRKTDGKEVAMIDDAAIKRGEAELASDKNMKIDKNFKVHVKERDEIDL